jgi:hypothetical protein
LKFGTDMHLMMTQNVGEFESELTFRSGDIAKKRKNRVDIGITPPHILSLKYETQQILANCCVHAGESSPGLNLPAFREIGARYL